MMRPWWTRERPRGRDATRSTLGLTALGVLPVLAACAGDDDAAPTTTTEHGGDDDCAPGPPAAPEELAVLPVHAADGDVLEITLTPAPATVDIGAAQPISTAAYDGAIPGAVWSLRPGQTLRVHGPDAQGGHSDRVGVRGAVVRDVQANVWASENPTPHAFGDISRYAQQPVPDAAVADMIELLTECPHREDETNESIWSLAGSAARS